MPEPSSQSSGGGDEPGPMPITGEGAGAGWRQLHHRQIIEEGGGSEEPIAKRKGNILYKGEAYLGRVFRGPAGSTRKQARLLGRGVRKKKKKKKKGLDSRLGRTVDRMRGFLDFV